MKSYLVGAESGDVERLLWLVFAATRGGPTRIRIVEALLQEPRNINVLAKDLGLDYKTVEYNLRVLGKHTLVVCDEPGRYGAAYRASRNLLAKRVEFDAIREQLTATRIGANELGKATSTDSAREV